MSSRLECALDALRSTLAATPASSIEAFLGAIREVLDPLARSAGRGQRADLRSLAVCLQGVLYIAQLERTRLDGEVDRFLADAEAKRIRYELEFDRADLDAAARTQLGAEWRRDLAEILT